MDRSTALYRLDQAVTRYTCGQGVNCTEGLTAAVGELCLLLGATSVVREHPCEYATKGAVGPRVAKGRVDVMARWPSGAALAVEIDRWHKEESIAKLRAMAAKGARVLWVRWNVRNALKGTAPDEIPTHWTRIAEPRPLRKHDTPIS